MTITYTLFDEGSGLIYCKDCDRITAQRILNHLTPEQQRGLKQGITVTEPGEVAVAWNGLLPGGAEQ